MKRVRMISAHEAAALVKDGDVLFAGGFGMTGNPVHLLHALADTDVRNLTYIGNNVGERNLGGGKLLQNGQIRKMIGSFFTSNPDAVHAAHSGAVAYELLPQGTLAEAIRAGGAGIGAFYTPTSAGTVLSREKETRLIDGKEYILEKSLRANVAFIRAWKADESGNLQYRMTEQNFNKAMATAADIVVAEVEHVVPLGAIAPDHIHTPSCYVDYVVQAHTTVEELGSSASMDASQRKGEDVRMQMALRAYAELRRGDIVNLGVGIPTLVADFIQPADGIILHTENGMLGVGPSPQDGGAMDYPVNAGKIPVTALQGSSYFDSSDSFAMIRGGHIDVAIMGGLQVDEHGDLANWAVPGKPLLGVGGAMDLAAGAKRLIVLMTHVDKDGSSKIVKQCTLPLTAKGSVDTIITDLAVLTIRNGRLHLLECMPGVSPEQVMKATGASIII
jgi:3-oxoacid CoA-transferase